MLAFILVYLLNRDFIVLCHGDEVEFQLNITSLKHVRCLYIKLVTTLHLFDSGLISFPLQVIGVPLCGVSYSFIILNSDLFKEVFNPLGDSEKLVTFYLFSRFFNFLYHSSALTPHLETLRHGKPFDLLSQFSR